MERNTKKVILNIKGEVEQISKHLINKAIKSKTVQIVLEEGLSDKITLTEALQEADKKGLDLVEMNNQNGVSICKIMDYRKFSYDAKKKKKQEKPKEKGLKEIKFRPNIGLHDLKTKSNKASELLEDGYKVKITVTYRGREMKLISGGKELLNQFIEQLTTEVNISKESKIEGNRYTIIVEKNKE